MRSPKIEKALNRFPDYVIGSEEDPYLLRWYVIPRNRFLNIYLHKFCRSDDDRALHDHPWLFNISILLKGEYIEHLPLDRKNPGNMCTVMKHRKSGSVYFRLGKAAHRVRLLTDVVGHEVKPCWTLFVTGPVVRKWGFYCKWGWRPWQEFIELRDGGNSTGRGCD